MKLAPTLIKDKLNTAISGITDIGWLFSKDPDSDFSRERKLPLDSMLRLMLKFSGKSLQSELSAHYVPPEKVYTDFQGDSIPLFADHIFTVVCFV